MKAFLRLEQVIAEEIIDLSYDVMEEMEIYGAGYHGSTQLLVDLWVSPAAKALKPHMGKNYERVKQLLVDSTKRAWSTHKFLHLENKNLRLIGIRMQISRNLHEVISIAEKDFNTRSNILVLSNDEDEE
jgi:hypothetical protein